MDAAISAVEQYRQISPSGAFFVVLTLLVRRIVFNEEYIGVGEDCSENNALLTPDIRRNWRTYSAIRAGILVHLAIYGKLFDMEAGTGLATVSREQPSRSFEIILYFMSND